MVVTFPYILDYEVYVWNDCQTIIYIYIYMCVCVCEGNIGQLCTELRDFWWYICPAKDEPWKIPLQNDVISFPFCS